MPRISGNWGWKTFGLKLETVSVTSAEGQAPQRLPDSVRHPTSELKAPDRLIWGLQLFPTPGGVSSSVLADERAKPRPDQAIATPNSIPIR